MDKKTKALSLPLISFKTKDLAWTIGLILAVTITPAILAHTTQNQWITGTIVNATLFLAAYKLRFFNAILVAIIPSTIALTRGLLPLPMAMLLPYIILSNIVLIAIFSTLKKKILPGVVLASLGKFLFLYLITFFIAKNLNNSLLSMLQWPQLITALAGGFLALMIIKVFLNKNKFKNQN